MTKTEKLDLTLGVVDFLKNYSEVTVKYIISETSDDVFLKFYDETIKVNDENLMRILEKTEYIRHNITRPYIVAYRAGIYYDVTGGEDNISKQEYIIKKIGEQTLTRKKIEKVGYFEKLSDTEYKLIDPKLEEDFGLSVKYVKNVDKKYNYRQPEGADWNKNIFIAEISLV